MKLRYFLQSEVASMSKEELALQGTLGLQCCKTKEDAMNILLDMYDLGSQDVKLKITNNQESKGGMK